MNHWMRGGLLFAATLASVASVAPSAHAEGGQGVLSTPFNKLPSELLTCISNELSSPFDRLSLGEVCNSLRTYTTEHLKVVRDQSQLDAALTDAGTTTIVAIPEKADLKIERAPANPNALISTYDTRTDDSRAIVSRPEVTVSTSFPVTATGTSRVYAIRSAQITALDKSEVLAGENAHVNAYDDSRIDICHSATVNAHNNVRVKAIGSGLVNAYGKSTVITKNKSTIHAYDQVEVTIDFWSVSEAIAHSTSVRIFGANQPIGHV